MNGASLAVSGWLITYGLHSVLLFTVLLIAERLWARSAAVGDLLYKVGAFAPLLTASLQVALLTRAPAVEPLGGRWELPHVNAMPHQVGGPIGRVGEWASGRVGEPASGASAPTFAMQEPGVTAPETRRAPMPWYTLLVGVWLSGALVSLAFFVRRYARAHRRFAHRMPPSDLGLVDALERMRASMGYALPVKLTVCDGVVSPVALNRGEICLPTGLLASLTPDQVESMIAHELAHLRRRDPAWLLAFGCLEAVFYFQPLNRIARRRFQVYAERLCDQWSVDYACRPLALAQCLAQVARWLRGAEPVPYPGMAESDSPLLARVQRVLSGDRERLSPTYTARAAAVVAVALIPAIAPAVGWQVTAVVRESTDAMPSEETGFQQVEIASAVRSLSNGTVRFAYETRPSVCGTGEEKDGTRLIALQPAPDWLPAERFDLMVLWVIDGYTMMRNVVGTDGTWTTPCLSGVARIDLGVREGRVQLVTMSVGEPAPRLASGAKDLGRVTTANAKDYLLALARTAGPDVRDRALIAAMLVRDGVTQRDLSELAQDRVEMSKDASEWRRTLRGRPILPESMRDLSIVADLKVSMAERLAALERATRAGLTVRMVIAAYDDVPDRAMRVELIDWLGQREDADVRTKLREIVKNAAVYEEQQAALRVLRNSRDGAARDFAAKYQIHGLDEVVENRTYNYTYAGAPQTALGRRIAAEDGLVLVTYDARAEACGSGIDRDGAGMFALLPTDRWHPAGVPDQAAFYSFDADDFTRLSLSPNPSWTSKCQHGFAHLLLTVRGRHRQGSELTGGQVVRLQIIVGPEPQVAVSEALNYVPGPEVANFLLELAARADQSIASDAILAAVIAGGNATLYPELLRIAADLSRPERVRQTALHWVAFDPTPGAKEVLRRVKESLPKWRPDDDNYAGPASIGESRARMLNPNDLDVAGILAIAIDDRQPMETRKKAIDWAAARGVKTTLLASLRNQVADADLRAHIDRVIEKRK